MEHLRGLILLKGGADAAVDLPKEVLADMKKVAERATMPQLSRAAKLFREVEQQFDGYSPLPMELALVECTTRAKDDHTPHTMHAPAKAEAPPIKTERPAAPAAPVAEKPPLAPRKAQPVKPVAEAAPMSP